MNIAILGASPNQFRYSHKANLALKEEGFRVILVNSNPATIMTDPGMADAIYIEPLHWTAVHRDVSERGFTDIQTAGPAKTWEHTHTFTPLTEDTTEIQEHIKYEHKSGFWGLVTRVLFARPNLYLMFTYRKLSTRRYLRRSAP